MWMALLTKTHHCYSPNHLHMFFCNNWSLTFQQLLSNNFWKYSLLKILPVIITTWCYTLPLGLMIQDIKCKFPWYNKSQHLTPSTRISSSCSNVSILISWINLKDQWTWSGLKMCWQYQCRKTMGHFISGPTAWFTSGHPRSDPIRLIIIS